MDPDTCLAEIRAANQRGDAASNNETAAAAYETAANLFRDLDEWLSKGGFPPAAWGRAVRRAG